MKLDSILESSNSKESKAKKLFIGAIVVVVFIFIGVLVLIFKSYSKITSKQIETRSNISVVKIENNLIRTSSPKTQTNNSNDILERIQALKSHQNQNGAADVEKGGPNENSISPINDIENKQDSPDLSQYKRRENRDTLNSYSEKPHKDILKDTDFSQKQLENVDSPLDKNLNELDLNEFISQDPFENNTPLNHVSNIEAGARFQGLLIKTIDSNDVDKLVLATIKLNDENQFKVSGSYSLSQNNNLVYIQFKTLIFEDGSQKNINAIAYSQNNTPGIEGEIDYNSKNDILKSVSTGLIDITATILNKTYGAGGDVLESATNKSIETLETNIHVIVPMHTIFNIYFNEGVTL